MQVDIDTKALTGLPQSTKHYTQVNSNACRYLYASASTARSFGELSGPLPAQLDGQDVWFECDHFNAAELIAHYSKLDFGHAWKFVLAFRIGASFPALLSAYIAATAYASATDGEIFDEADGKLYTPVEALKLCHDLKRETPQLELQMKEVRKRPREALNPSPAIVSTRIGDADDESG